MLCAEFVYICVRFCSAEPLIIEQELSIATTTETDLQHKLLSVQQSWILETWWMLLTVFLTKIKLLKNFVFQCDLELCVNLKDSMQSVTEQLSWKKRQISIYGTDLARIGSSSTNCACKKVLFSSMCQSH
jgi:hypothetical protein